MDIYNAFLELIEKPNAIKVYRKLGELYRRHNMQHEAQAFDYLVEQRFPKNEKPHHDNPGDKE